MKLFLIATVILGLALLGLAIRIILVRNGRFNKSCSTSFDPDGKRSDCMCGGKGKEDETQCEYYNEHHGSQPPKSS